MVDLESERTYCKSGHHLPNYKIFKKVGNGNFSNVCLGMHRPTQEMVAIKIINKNMVKRKQIGDLTREISNLKHLNHPNIVRLYEHYETKNYLYIITEYVGGGELFQYLSEKGRMKENLAREKFRQILSAVNYCHERGIVHRDLKAENILIDSHNNLIIVDFGFSNRFCWSKRMHTYCGSPQYAAPELFVGNGYIGPEVDIWALGVILYAMLTATLPFNMNKLSVFL
ncbi:Serine/threonine-protein kinase MARK2 [Thelohanellus kitauei]|uniref:non-specific serine/threonine protein kinase n=1 Tax=Thelohanellus kitauei TaxID=669202 RepID=A0A0C2J437_THEKT|nr:Serine/threonine-protein kinase MARK2 [Thelohanellus kitauei]